MLIERTANYTDFDFFYGTLLNGARHGHYSVDVENPDMLDRLKSEIHSVIRYRMLLDGRSASASVFTRNNTRVALLMTCDSPINPQDFEIYALSVAKKFRKQGFGGMVLDQLLKRLYRADIIARCSPQSSTLQQMLEKRGFVQEGCENGFNLLYRSSPMFDERLLHIPAESMFAMVNHRSH